VARQEFDGAVVKQGAAVKQESESEQEVEIEAMESKIPETQEMSTQWQEWENELEPEKQPKEWQKPKLEPEKQPKEWQKPKQ